MFLKAGNPVAFYGTGVFGSKYASQGVAIAAVPAGALGFCSDGFAPPVALFFNSIVVVLGDYSCAGDALSLPVKIGGFDTGGAVGQCRGSLPLFDGAQIGGLQTVGSGPGNEFAEAVVNGFGDQFQAVGSDYGGGNVAVRIVLVVGHFLGLARDFFYFGGDPVEDVVFVVGDDSVAVALPFDFVATVVVTVFGDDAGLVAGKNAPGAIIVVMAGPGNNGVELAGGGEKPGLVIDEFAEAVVDGDFFGGLIEDAFGLGVGSGPAFDFCPFFRMGRVGDEVAGHGVGAEEFAASVTVAGQGSGGRPGTFYPAGGGVVFALGVVDGDGAAIAFVAQFAGGLQAVFDDGDASPEAIGALDANGLGYGDAEDFDSLDAGFRLRMIEGVFGFEVER